MDGPRLRRSSTRLAWVSPERYGCDVNTIVDNPELVPIRPAATVIPLRDGAKNVEVLVLRRDTKLAFHGGSWVFPGGRVDDHEFEQANGNDLAAARLAAAREAHEEAGIHITPQALVPFSHWTTPLGRNRRFATWFFVAAAPDGQVVIDDGEIREFEWHPIAEAIERCQAGDVQLAGPTYVSLLEMTEYPTVADALADITTKPNPVFLPRLIVPDDPDAVDFSQVSVYQDDPAYKTGDLAAAGPQHRLYMPAVGYRYVNDFDQTHHVIEGDD